MVKKITFVDPCKMSENYEKALRSYWQNEWKHVAHEGHSDYEESYIIE